MRPQHAQANGLRPMAARASGTVGATRPDRGQPQPLGLVRGRGRGRVRVRVRVRVRARVPRRRGTGRPRRG